ncbi:DUF58 domain-containing protein [Methylomonas sp. AM2-LC]|uniref:DUF58 domain-containing protein n=1 Tax=Methylomonas sp. AM2-LC TaxID=3153301 RepID=UPI0032665AA7
MSISRPALLLIGLLILFAVIGIWCGPPLQGLWRWPAALLIMMAAWERFRLTNSYTLQRQISPVLPLGEACHYTLTIGNHSNVLLYLETQADYPHNLSGNANLQRWQLKAGNSQSHTLTIIPKQLGTTELGAVYLKQLGQYGICWWTRRISDHIPLRVEPVRLTHNQQVIGIQSLGNRYSRYLQSSGLEFLELQDYRTGDALRNIDWKATARRGKPMVRRFSRDQCLEMVVLVDCGRSSRLQSGNLDRLHHYVNTAAKLSEYACLHGDRIANIAYAQQVLAKTGMAGGMHHLSHIRLLLGQLSALNETANALNATLEIKQVLKRRGLVVFLTEIEQPEAALQMLQAVKLLSAKHQVLVASLEDTQLYESLKKPARLWQDPYRQFAGLEYLRGRELTRKKLQALGVDITCGTAAELDEQILLYYHHQRDRISAA